MTPDTYVVRRDNLSILSRRIGDKRLMVIPAESGNRDVQTPRVFHRRSTLDEVQVVDLARLAIALEGVMGWAVDVECAYWAEVLHVLQSRPATASDSSEVASRIALTDRDVAERQPLDQDTMSTPIPVPDDFPVVWQAPDDARRFWFINRMHHSEPILPLVEPFLRHLYEHGINFGARAYG